MYMYIAVACDLNEFQCLNGLCIPNDYLCDEYNDCSNGEDEQNCNIKRYELRQHSLFYSYTP